MELVKTAGEEDKGGAEVQAPLIAIQSVSGDPSASASATLTPASTSTFTPPVTVDAPVQSSTIATPASTSAEIPAATPALGRTPSGELLACQEDSIGSMPNILSMVLARSSTHHHTELAMRYRCEGIIRRDAYMQALAVRVSHSFMYICAL
ncbi:hypothetical protein PENSPDRAFT_740057, partial [Peniophora sp. CONT]